jgi:hypothetical protein
MMFDGGIGRRIRAAITSIEDSIIVFVAILGVTDQATGQDTKRRATGRPTATFESAQTATDQAADNAADWPGSLIEGGGAIAVSSATGQQAAQQHNRQDGPCENTHGESSCVTGQCRSHRSKDAHPRLHKPRSTRG